MNLVDQIFEQAKAGSAQGQGFGQFFAEGVQAGQRQQQLDVQKQQLAMELGQAQLKQTLLQQDAAMNQAKLNSYLEDRQVEANAGLAFAALQGEVNPLIAAGKIDEAQNKIIAAGAANGFLLADPKKRLHGLFDMTTKAQDAKLELLKARTSEYPPKLVTVTDPETGKKYPVIQTGPHVSQVVDPEKDALKKRDQELRLQQIQQHLPEAAKAELHSLYKKIDRKEEERDALPEMSGMVWNRQPNPKRAVLQKEIDSLKEQAKALSSAPAAKAAPVASNIPTPPASVPVSTDRVVVRDAKGNRFYLPSSELEKAARQGYTPE